jgi:hypothetical protein
MQKMPRCCVPRATLEDAPPIDHGHGPIFGPSPLQLPEGKLRTLTHDPY